MAFQVGLRRARFSPLDDSGASAARRASRRVTCRRVRPWFSRFSSHLRVSPRVAPLTPRSPPPRVPSSQVAITDNDAWTEEIEKVKGATLVVDVHQNWTGPCVAAQGTLRKIAFDHGDKPLKFFTADASRLTALHDYSGPCEPLFMVIKDDNRVEIKGLDAPKLRAAILEKLGVAE